MPAPVDFPEHILNEMRAIMPRVVVKWLPWEEPDDGVLPLFGLPFLRSILDDKSVRCTIYDVEPQSWKIPSNEATPGRYIAFERIQNKDYKVVDIVDESGRWIDLQQNGRAIAMAWAIRRDAWAQVTPDILEEKKQAAIAAGKKKYMDELNYRIDHQAQADCQIQGFSVTSSGLLVPEGIAPPGVVH